MLTIVKPDEIPINAQFDILREDESLKEGLLFFNDIWGLYTICRLTIKKAAQKTIVLLTELPDNPGTPVTRISCEIASYVKNVILKHTRPDEIIWIEHYMPKLIPRSLQKESFFIVSYNYSEREKTFKYSNPSWKKIPGEKIFDIAGDTAQ